MIISGIYRIVCKLNNKQYIGSACNIKIRKQNYFSIIGNELLIKKIQDVLILRCDLKKLKLHKDSRCKNNIVTLCYGGNKQIEKIYNYLYKNCDDLYLTRKKEKFKNVKIINSNNKFN